jgi:hypothetical protein
MLHMAIFPHIRAARIRSQCCQLLTVYMCWLVPKCVVCTHTWLGRLQLWHTAALRAMDAGKLLVQGLAQDNA